MSTFPRDAVSGSVELFPADEAGKDTQFPFNDKPTGWYSIRVLHILVEQLVRELERLSVKTLLREGPFE